MFNTSLALLPLDSSSPLTDATGSSQNDCYFGSGADLSSSDRLFGRHGSDSPWHLNGDTDSCICAARLGHLPGYRGISARTAPSKVLCYLALWLLPQPWPRGPAQHEPGFFDLASRPVHEVHTTGLGPKRQLSVSTEALPREGAVMVSHHRLARRADRCRYRRSP